MPDNGRILKITERSAGDDGLPEFVVEFEVEGSTEYQHPAVVTALTLPTGAELKDAISEAIDLTLT